MFTLSSEQKYLLYSHPTDMRKSFDGLSGLIEGRNPMSGEVFLFINKSRDKMKLLHWSGSGYTLYYKRLETGQFELSTYQTKQAGGIKLSYAHLVMIIDGLSIKNVKIRKQVQLSTGR